MNIDPSVSVIIATHNHAHFLPECLASVKAQTYKDYEVIVVDNGSTDNTRDVVRDLSWNKLRYHYQDNTGSVAGPRNTGIKLARGEFVAFLDSDDLWYEQKLERAIGALNKDARIDILSHDLFFVKPGKEKSLIRTGPLKDDMFTSLLIENCLLGSATVVKKSVMLDIGGFDGSKDFIHAEDYEAWLRIAYLSKKFYFINEALGEYRIHGANLSLDFETALLNERNVITAHFRNLKTGIPFFRLFLLRNRLCVLYLKMGTQYAFRKRYLHSFMNLARAFLLNPFLSSKNFIGIIGRNI